MVDAGMFAWMFRFSVLHAILLNLTDVTISQITIKYREKPEELITKSEYCLIAFYDNTLPSSIETTLALVKKNTGIEVAKTRSQSFKTKYGITEAVQVSYFRGEVPIFIQDLEDGEELELWLMQNMKISSQSLGDGDFEHLTQAGTGATTGDWFVLFYDQTYTSFAGTWEAMASRNKQRMNSATVNITLNTSLKKRFDIGRSPSLIYFRLGNMYAYSFTSVDLKSLLKFTDGWYKQSRAVKVPLEPTPFDELTTQMAEHLKHLLDDTQNLYTILGAIGLVSAATIAALLICTKYTRPEKHKEQ